jgi:hypothetical protein
MHTSFYLCMMFLQFVDRGMKRGRKPFVSTYPTTLHITSLVGYVGVGLVSSCSTRVAHFAGTYPGYRYQARYSTVIFL